MLASPRRDRLRIRADLTVMWKIGLEPPARAMVLRSMVSTIGKWTPSSRGCGVASDTPDACRVDHVLIVQNQPEIENREAPENINVFRGFFGCGGSLQPRATHNRGPHLIRLPVMHYYGGSDRPWVAAVGGRTAFVDPGSPWESGHIESFNARLRNQLLNGEKFYTLKEAQVLIELWRCHYNAIRPHGSLRYRPPAPDGRLAKLAARLRYTPPGSQLGRKTRYALTFNLGQSTGADQCMDPDTHPNRNRNIPESERIRCRRASLGFHLRKKERPRSSPRREP